jgi:Zn-dependent protease/CBS domain-containing protein
MFGRRFELCKLFGFPIRIDLSWFFIVLLLSWSLAGGLFPHLYGGLTVTTYWVMGVSGALALFVSILLHELGHALVARRYGVEMRGITLFIFGGVAEMSDEPPSAKAEFFVAIAGPIVSIVLAGAFWAVAQAPLPTAVYGVLAYLATINVILVAFNMVPAFPLDGGRVLRSALWQWKNNLRWATRITSQIGSAFGIVLMVLAVFELFGGDFIGAIWFFVLGMFLRGAALTSYQQVLARTALRGEPIGKLMNDHPTTVTPDLPLDRFVDDFIYKYHHKMFPAVDHGMLRGCVNLEDVKQVPRGEWAYHHVGEIMRPCNGKNTIPADADALDAMRKMSREDSSRLLVVDHDRLVGMIAMKDMMRFLSLKLELDQEEDDAGHWGRAA